MALTGAVAASAPGTPEGPQRWPLLLVKAFVAAILIIGLFLALVVPFHATDALVYGQWSRLMGVHGGFFYDAVGYTPYARPLFYVPQGVLWELFGAHEWIGRLLSLAFFALLLWSVFRLAADRSLPPIAPWLALVLLLATPDVVQQALAGQTDVPVAAMIALTGVLAWRSRSVGPLTVALLVLAAAGAVLAKSTALPALAGLILAMLLGDRAGLRDRLRFPVAPLVGGTLVGVVYDVLMAHHFGLPINAFLGDSGAIAAPAASGATEPTTVVGAATTQAAAHVPDVFQRTKDAFSLLGNLDRDGMLARVEWFGPYVRLLLIFAIVYGIARVVMVRHRLAAFIALGVGLIGYWVGPEVLPGGPSITSVSGGALVGSLLLTVPLAGVAWCPPQWQASRLLLGRLLVWAVLPFGAWAIYGILTDTRTLSPAWPALFVLMAAVAAMGIAGLATRRAWLGAGAILLLLALAVLSFRTFDGLGARPDGSISSLRALKELTPSTWTNPDAARSAADPQLGGLVADTRATRGAGERVWTNDGRMIFYFLDQTTVTQPPTDCAQLHGYGVVALLGNVATPFDASGFRCLTPVRVVPGSYAVYRVDRS
jgi:4-amino-4-deoxy-L-arabinose transferase-like glycosyltransferase